MRQDLAAAWRQFRDDSSVEVAIFTGTGRGFCAGEDMKETVEIGRTGERGPRPENPFEDGTIDKPVICAINGYAMGGGFQLVERTDLRVAVRGAIFEMSEAKRWLLGGYQHGFIGGLPHPIATEMAFAFRFTAERLYELGWINRLCEPDELMPTAKAMAEHILTLPPASRVNTLTMMRQMRPRVSDDIAKYAEVLNDHGAKSDLMESRRAFAEKRTPNFIGWDDPADRARTPKLDSVRENGA
jgi:enoyl-CoA hydratase/carnithine racemase